MNIPLSGWRGRAKLQPSVRKVMLAGLAIFALTMAYPMSARRSSTPASHTAPRGETDVKPAVDVHVQGAADPQLSFSMRTVVYPTVAAESPEGHKATVGTGVDTAPTFEGYITQPGRR